VCPGNFGGRKVATGTQDEAGAPRVADKRFEEAFYLRHIFHVARCLIVPDSDEAEGELQVFHRSTYRQNPGRAFPMPHLHLTGAEFR
jgi:hypothetical protein